MKVLNLTAGSKIYTSNVYLVTGTWNTLNDKNTLIDVGRDPTLGTILENLTSTGVGKKKVEQVLLTHCHYDHTSLLPALRQKYHPMVYAGSASVPGVDRLLGDGEIIKIGDRQFEAIHTPGHSQDSFCFYSPEEKVLFAGDTPLVIGSFDQTYNEEFVRAFQYISKKDIQMVYFGHGPPLRSDCRQIIRNSLRILLAT